MCGRRAAAPSLLACQSTPPSATRSAPTCRWARASSPAPSRRPTSSGARPSRSSSATRAAGPLGRQARRGRRVPRRDRRARHAGVHPRAVPRQPRLPHPATYEKLGRRRSRTTCARAAEIGAEGVVVHTGSCVDPTGHASSTTPRCARSARGCCRCSTRSATTTRAVAAARADRRAGPVAVRRRRGPRALPGGARPPPEAGHLPRHLPRVRRRRPARRARRHDRHRRPDRRDRRPGPAAAGARQRLDGRARRLQGPAPEDRRGPHRRSTPSRSCSRTRRPTGCRSSWRRPARATPATPTSRCSSSCAQRRRRDASGVRPSSPRLALLAMTAVLGLDVLPDQGPARPGADAGLPGGPVRDRQRRAAADRRPARGRAGCRRRSRGTRVVLGLLYGVAQILQTAGLAHTAGQRVAASSPACTSSPPRCFAALLLRHPDHAG